MHSIRQAKTSKTAVASRKIAPKEEVSLVTYSFQCLNSRIEPGTYFENGKLSLNEILT